jgi:hypothetical protein
VAVSRPRRRRGANGFVLFLLHWEVRMQPFAAAPILAAEVAVTHTYLPNEL